MFPQAGRAALLSTQGFVISLPYCFLNTEVQGVLRSVMVQGVFVFISDIRLYIYAVCVHNVTVRDLFTVITIAAVIVIIVELTKVPVPCHVAIKQR